MTNVIKKIQQFISHWYLRYLLVTELYMLEPWEKRIIQTTFAIMFLVYWYFNYAIVMHGIGHLRRTAITAE